MQGVISASYYEVLAAAVLKEAFVAGRCSGPLLCHGSCRIKPQQLALTINICEFVLTGFHRISVTVHIHPAGYLLTNNLEATDGRGRWTRASLSAQAANQVCRSCSAILSASCEKVLVAAVFKDAISLKCLNRSYTFCCLCFESYHMMLC